MQAPQHKRFRGVVAAATGSVLLSACFGGGGSDAPAAPPVAVYDPLLTIGATATVSVAGLLQYQAEINSSPQSRQDTAEPLDVSSLVLPTSETAEPADVS